MLEEDEPVTFSERSRNSAAEEFSKRLLRSVEAFHLHANHRQSNVHIVNLLTATQLGGVSASAKIDFNVVRGLIRSGTRSYSCRDTYRVRGSATYSGRRLISLMSRQLFCLDLERTTTILGFAFSERIVSTLTVEFQPPREDGLVAKALLLVLSNLGRLRFCDLNTGECLHTFQLPCRRYKFKHIHWNKVFSEVWLLGRTVLPGFEDGSERCGSTPSIAVFEIQPPRFKALLQLDKNHCTHVYDPMKGELQKENISFNIKLTVRPKPLLTVKGSFSGVYFGGCCKVILCEPQTSREKYVLKEISSNEAPVLHGLQLHGPEQGVALAIDCSTMMLCRDDSSNFLRFEGIHLACYQISSLASEPERNEVRVRWRTALLPMRRSATDGLWLTGASYRDSITTKFGRVSRTTVSGSLVDNVPARVLKMAYDGGADVIHLLVSYDIANMDGCYTVGAEPDPDWISLIISIRGLTGEIYKVTPVNPIHFDSMRKVELVAEDELIVLSCYDGKRTSVELYKLTETDARSWVPEVATTEPVANYTSNVLSRKQRRKERSGRTPAAQRRIRNF
ncbi:hypothetical protein Q1695_012431 [Nippostrongylus brasiliensis]|nr:hypothetical protein Q1695_012431 [Nippostrongylus brasiliensis]